MIQIASRGNKYYSPLRYPGGKSCLSDFLTDVIESNQLQGSTYVEPYAGGAGAALTLLMLEKVEDIVINDLDEAIYAFWKSVTEQPNKFIQKLEKIEVSVIEWQKQKEIYRRKSKDILKLGFSTFYLNRTNRSGIIEGGVIGGSNQQGKWGIDARFNKEALIERIEKIALYKNRISVSNKDGILLIKELRRKKKVFAYLDPPYYVKGGSLYLNHYRHEDHERLANLLNNSSNLHWMLTYDNIDEIKKMYSARACYEFSLNYHADTAKVGQELLILSDQLKLPRGY
jgi:DNA adenine methylase